MPKMLQITMKKMEWDLKHESSYDTRKSLRILEQLFVRLIIK